MKKTIILATLLIAITALTTSCSGSVFASENNQTRTMYVSGTGKVKIKPDIAYVNIGIRSQSPEVTEAFSENNTLAERIIQKLSSMGVEQKDIQTRNFNLYQQQESRFNGEEEPQITYIVENTIAVAVRDLDSLGEVLSTMVSEGANTIHGVTFDVEDRETAVEEARKLAIADAKSQAEEIANAADVKLGIIRKISINQDGGITPRIEYAEEAAMGGGAVPISSGTMTVEVTANLTYDID